MPGYPCCCGPPTEPICDFGSSCVVTISGMLDDICSECDEIDNVYELAFAGFLSSPVGYIDSFSCEYRLDSLSTPELCAVSTQKLVAVRVRIGTSFFTGNQAIQVATWIGSTTPIAVLTRWILDDEVPVSGGLYNIPFHGNNSGYCDGASSTCTVQF